MALTRSEKATKSLLDAIDRRPHDETIHTHDEPAQPAGRGSAVTLYGWVLAFLVIVMLFFYALRGG
jgi:hypothetical protein